MDLLRRAGRYIPAGRQTQLPVADEKLAPKVRPGKTWASRLAFFRKPMRIRGNSSVSVPLGVVILFPCIVILLMIVLFVRHPNSPGIILRPAGSPPAIRYVE